MTSDTIIQGVRDILRKYPESRDSYNWLWYLYCREELAKYGLKLFIPFEVLNGQIPFPSLESVTRACRKIQNTDGDFKPSFSMQQIRAEKEVQVKEWATKGIKDYGARTGGFVI